MSPSNTPDDEAALIAHEHAADDPHPDYVPDDPRDLPGVAPRPEHAPLLDALDRAKRRARARGFGWM